MHATSLAEGQLLNGRYRLREFVAAGAMGMVWRAEDTHLYDRSCAVKVPLLDGGTAEERAEQLAWFEREARILATLHHPDICAILDVIADPPSVVLDWIEGLTLEAELRAHGAPGLPESRVMGWAAVICAALGYLHGQKPPIVVRDVKPTNIMLRAGDRPVLIDFGLARGAMTHGAATTIGTGGYAAPEQYQGLADPRSDEYALAATLHHLLSGRDPVQYPPFSFPPMCAVNPRIRPQVGTALARALSLRADDRYATIGEFLIALQGTSTPPRPASTAKAVATNSPAATAGPVVVSRLESEPDGPVLVARRSGAEAIKLVLPLSEGRVLVRRGEMLEQWDLRSGELAWSREVGKPWKLLICPALDFVLEGYEHKDGRNVRVHGLDRSREALLSDFGSRYLEMADDALLLVGAGDRSWMRIRPPSDITLLTFSPLDGTSKAFTRLVSRAILISDVAISADGGLVADARMDGTICVWEAATGRRRLLYRIPNWSFHPKRLQKRGYGDPMGPHVNITGDQLAWWYLAGGTSEMIKGEVSIPGGPAPSPWPLWSGPGALRMIWETAMWYPQVRQWTAGTYCASPNGRQSRRGDGLVDAVVQDDGALYLSDAEGGPLLRALRPPEPLNGVCWTPDDLGLVAWSTTAIYTWNLQQGRFPLP